MALTAEEWIAQFAEALGRPAPDLAEVQAVLELASVAAHNSERRAAPVACWLAALAGAPRWRARRRARRARSPRRSTKPPLRPAQRRRVVDAEQRLRRGGDLRGA